MRNSSYRLPSERGDIASFRRHKMLVGWAAVAVLLLFGIVVSLTYPSGLDVASDDAAIARIDSAGVEDTVRGHVGPPEATPSGKVVERRAAIPPGR